MVFCSTAMKEPLTVYGHAMTPVCAISSTVPYKGNRPTSLRCSFAVRSCGLWCLLVLCQYRAMLAKLLIEPNATITGVESWDRPMNTHLGRTAASTAETTPEPKVAEACC